MPRYPSYEDHGTDPYVVNVEKETLDNENFRTTLWTGQQLQVTLMSIPPGGEIGLEMHEDVDQFLRLESGEGVVMMGRTRNALRFRKNVRDTWAILIPAGTWHNLVNMGDEPIKLYSIYAPVQHPVGTVHETKADSDAAE